MADLEGLGEFRWRSASGEEKVEERELLRKWREVVKGQKKGEKGHRSRECK